MTNAINIIDISYMYFLRESHICFVEVAGSELNISSYVALRYLMALVMLTLIGAFTVSRIVLSEIVEALILNN